MEASAPNLATDDHSTLTLCRCYRRRCALVRASKVVLNPSEQICANASCSTVSPPPLANVVSLLGRRKNVEDATVAVMGLAAGPMENEVGRHKATGEGEAVEMWKQEMVAGFARVDAEVMQNPKELQSFGDYVRKPYVSAEPEFMVIECSEEDQFLILASDRYAAAMLARLAICRGSFDNVTVMLMVFWDSSLSRGIPAT
ncbi:hypothetical protein ZIOFF_066060 [Zingiber officinale]|uniref:protein-serine/threonine phosphatase n=1 Tax=Zingiber officinale TaxID=94328 RepID=A0A8J5EY25_ZINOF|nr:hypothetical protein ZIOFF_066060 [Zingiber officinale]